MADRPVRVLVVTDHVEPTPQIVDALRDRASKGPVQFRLLIPNPARAEAHLRHPEHHDKAEAAERALHNTLPVLEDAVGGRVLGSVSIRHDPYDAIEETMLNEPIDEFIIAIAPHGHGLSEILHLDLAHRLTHFARPIATVSPE